MREGEGILKGRQRGFLSVKSQILLRRRLGHQAPEARCTPPIFCSLPLSSATQDLASSLVFHSKAPPPVSNNLLLHVKPHPGNFPLHTAKTNSQGAIFIGKTPQSGAALHCWADSRSPQGRSAWRSWKTLTPRIDFHSSLATPHRAEF